MYIALCVFVLDVETNFGDSLTNLFVLLKLSHVISVKIYLFCIC